MLPFPLSILKWWRTITDISGVAWSAKGVNNHRHINLIPYDAVLTPTKRDRE